MRTNAVRICIIALLASASSIAQTTFGIAEGSKLWIDGSSTVNTFSCSTVQIDGNAHFVGDSSSVEVDIIVHSLHCGNDRMNDDMYNAMKASTHPSIHYSLAAVGNVVLDSIADEFHIDTEGLITIAGVSKKINIPIDVHQLGYGRYLITGKKDLAMHDFNITPPSAFFGIIKAHDQLIVNFALIAEKISGGGLQFVSHSKKQ